MKRQNQGQHTGHKHGQTRRKFIKTMAVASAAGCATLTGGIKAPLAAGRALRWGSSSLGSSGYVIMETLSQLVNKYTSFRNSAASTAGTTENMVLIGRGELEFGHSVTTDWLFASKGIKPFHKVVKATQLMSYATWHEPPLVHANSDIHTIEDLAGKRFSPSKAGSGSALLYHIIMSAIGMDKKIRWTYGSWSEVYSAFRARQLDGVVGVLTNGAPSSRVIQAEAAVAVRPLEFSRQMLEKAQQVNPGILIDSLGSKDWKTLKAPMVMPLFAGVIVTSPTVSAETGYQVTKAILDHAQEARKFGKALQGISLENSVRYLMPQFPVNAGAAQYFKEKGVWRKELKIAG